MSDTIFVGHKPGTYKAYQTIGGWKIQFLDENGNIRSADGDKLYPSRQNAYYRAKILNESISDGTLHWFYVERKDGKYGSHVQAEHKQEALGKVAASCGGRKRDFRARELNPDDGEVTLANPERK